MKLTMQSIEDFLERCGRGMVQAAVILFVIRQEPNPSWHLILGFFLVGIGCAILSGVIVGLREAKEESK